VAITAALCGNFDEAVRLGAQALALQERLSGKKWYPRLLADLAIWCGRSGDLPAARRYVDEMLAFDVPLGTESPQNCPWAAAQVLRAGGEHSRAQQQLERAYRLVAMMAEQLSGTARTHFEAISWNREIRAARERDEWAVFAEAPNAAKRPRW
jgi:hypothetical protein